MSENHRKTSNVKFLYTTAYAAAIVSTDTGYKWQAQAIQDVACDVFWSFTQCVSCTNPDICVHAQPFSTPCTHNNC